MAFRTIGNTNITRVVPVNLALGDFTDETGFFLRSGTGGYIKYCPIGNSDSEYIIKLFVASVIFDDPEVVRKVFSTGITGSPDASEIYAGYGV